MYIKSRDIWIIYFFFLLNLNFFPAKYLPRSKCPLQSLHNLNYHLPFLNIIASTFVHKPAHEKRDLTAFGVILTKSQSKIVVLNFRISLVWDFVF